MCAYFPLNPIQAVRLIVIKFGDKFIFGYSNHKVTQQSILQVSKEKQSNRRMTEMITHIHLRRVTR